MSFAVRVSRAFFWNHANKVVGFFLDFCLSIVLARGLGTHLFGVYSELFNVVVFFSLFCSLGLDTSLNVFLPKYRNNPEGLSTLIKKTLIVFTLISVLVCSTIYFFSQFISNVINSPEIKNHLFFVALYTFLYTFIILAQAILLSLFKTKFLFFANTILKTLFIGTAIWLIYNGLGIKEIFLAFIFISVIISFGYFNNFRKYLRAKTVVIESYKYLKFGITVLFTKFLNYVLGRYFDIFLLGYFSVSKEYIGYYNIAFSITLAMSFMFTSGFAGIALTAFSDLVKKKNFTGVSNGWITITKISIFFCLPIFLFVLINAKSIISVAYSSDYINAAILLKVFGGFFLISILLGSGANSTVLYSLQKERIVLILRAALGGVNIVLDIILIPQFYALGAIFATGVSTVLIIMTEYIFLKREIKLTYPKIFLLKTAGASILAMCVIVLLPDADFWNLLLRLFVSVAVFGITIYALKPFTVDDYRITKEVLNPLAKYLKPFVK